MSHAGYHILTKVQPAFVLDRSSAILIRCEVAINCFCFCNNAGRFENDLNEGRLKLEHAILDQVLVTRRCITRRGTEATSWAMNASTNCKPISNESAASMIVPVGVDLLLIIAIIQ